jgi:hypothetical protein
MKPRLLSITRTIGLGAAFAIVAVIGGAIFLFLSHRKSVAVSAQRAAAEFSELRQHFPNQRPLLDMNRREASETLNVREGQAQLRSFHTVIFDTRGSERLVRITVPYWFACQFAGKDGDFNWLGQLTFLDDTEFDAEAIHLSLVQLERRGPGLVVDFKHPGGGQFMSWVE